MKRIIRYAQCLELLSLFGFLVFIMGTCARWILGSSFYDASEYMHYNPAQDVIASMPFAHRMAGLAVEIMLLSIIGIGVYNFLQILAQFKTGQFFVPTVISNVKRLSLVMLAIAIFNPIRWLLLSIITTWHNPVGQRVASLALGSSDIMNIFMFVCVLMISMLMQEGYAIKQERDLTI